MRGIPLCRYTYEKHTSLHYTYYTYVYHIVGIPIMRSILHYCYTYHERYT